MTTIRIVFSSDLHGSDLCFRKLLYVIKTYKAHLAIIGGDITGKALVPIIKWSDGTYSATLFGVNHTAKNDKELEVLKERIAAVGFYYKVVSHEEYEELQEDKNKLEQIFKDEMLKRIARWVSLAEQIVKDTKVRFLMMPGNDDIYDVDQIIEQSEYVENPHGRVLDYQNEYKIVGSAYSNITPWHCVRDVEEEVIERELDKLLTEISDHDKTILVTHVPPYNTHIDLAPALDENLRYVTKGGQLVFEHVGSKAVRKVIEKYQTLLGLHGHIHESKGFDKIGRTIVINPGSEYNEGILHAAIVTVSENKVKGHMIITG